MTLRFAFVGTGRIARTHARAAAAIPGVELAAALNHRAESLAVFADEFNISGRYTDLKTMLAREDLDALVISTPNALHAPQAIQALERSIHVLVEKPMCMDSAQAEQMVAASGNSGALLMVAHMWRFDPEVRWLRQQVEQGEIGNLVRSSGFAIHRYWGPEGWFVQKGLAGGGALADMGVHAIDTTRFILGDPEPHSVYARVGTYYGSYDVDDTAMLVINWQNGTSSYIEAGWHQPYASAPAAAVQVYGSRGYAQIFPARLQHLDAQGGPAELLEPAFTRPQHAPQSLYDEQMAYFVRCILGHTLPVPGGMEGWINMKILDAAYQSARSGKVVKINPYTGGTL